MTNVDDHCTIEGCYGENPRCGYRIHEVNESKVKTRPDWDTYYLGIADAVSKRADCTRRRVGAILVTARNRHRGSGYNGARSGGESCLAGQCPRGRMSTDEIAPGSSYDTGAGSCIAIHAEQNVILETTPEDRQGGTIYITTEPCDGCLRMLQGSGVVRIVWPEGVWKTVNTVAPIPTWVKSEENEV